MINHHSFNQPILILIRGIPGSGKSHFAQALNDALDTAAVVLDPDHIDFESKAYRQHVQTMITEGVNPAIHAYRFLKHQAQDAIRGRQVVIWNQPFTNLGMFERMIASLGLYATQQGTRLAVLIVEMEVDATLAAQRVAERKTAGGHAPSDQTLAARINEYRSVAGHDYRTIKIDGTAESRSSVTTVLRELAAL